jgi:DNA repair exonuclease SbcCD ATPase subunit
MTYFGAGIGVSGVARTRKGCAVEMRKERGADTVRVEQMDTGVAFAAVHTRDHAAQQKSDEERMSIFWRVFGGTIVSICALAAITVFNHLNNSLAELRSDISRINEARGEFIKKDEFNTRISTNYERVQQLQSQNNSQNATITSLQTAMTEMKDRVVAVKADAEAARKESLAADGVAKKEQALLLDAMKKEQAAINDALKKDLTAIEGLKDRLTAAEGMKKELDALKKDLAGLESVKDRLTMALAEVKDHRDEIARLKQESDRNQAADAERKKSRDEQYAKVLDAVKDLDKAVRLCAEKVARLEGATKPVAPMPKSGEDD